MIRRARSVTRHPFVRNGAGQLCLFSVLLFFSEDKVKVLVVLGA